MIGGILWELEDLMIGLVLGEFQMLRRLILVLCYPVEEEEEEEISSFTKLSVVESS